MTGIICFLIMLLLMFLSVPVIASMGLSSLLTLSLSRGGIKWVALSLGTANSLNSVTLLALPLFLLTGKIMNEGGITTRIFDFARKLVGWMPGGMAMVNIVASMIFGGMSGTAAADAGGLGAIEIKAMRESGYEDEFTGSVTAASAMLSPMIPPSLGMVIYASLTGVSVAGLFAAGLCMGVLWAAMMCILTQVYARVRHYQRDPFPTLKELWKSFKSAFLSLMAPVILLIGIYTGVFTATEAAAIVTIYATVLATIIYRLIDLKKLWELVKETALDIAVIGGVLAIASMFGQVIVRTKIPQHLITLITQYVDSKNMLLLLTMLLLIVLGMVMDGQVIQVILVPMMMMTIQAYGINLLHFGIMISAIMSMGSLTPPYGIVLFITARQMNMPVLRLAKAMIPWLLLMLVFVLLVVFVPGLTTWLPTMMGYM